MDTNFSHVNFSPDRREQSQAQCEAAANELIASAAKHTAKVMKLDTLPRLDADQLRVVMDVVTESSEMTTRVKMSFGKLFDDLNTRIREQGQDSKQDAALMTQWLVLESLQLNALANLCADAIINLRYDPDEFLNKMATVCSVAFQITRQLSADPNGVPSSDEELASVVMGMLNDLMSNKS